MSGDMNKRGSIKKGMGPFFIKKSNYHLYITFIWNLKDHEWAYNNQFLNILNLFDGCNVKQCSRIFLNGNSYRSKGNLLHSYIVSNPWLQGADFREYLFGRGTGKFLSYLGDAGSFEGAPKSRKILIKFLKFLKNQYTF